MYNVVYSHYKRPPPIFFFLYWRNPTYPKNTPTLEVFVFFLQKLRNFRKKLRNGHRKSWEIFIE